MKTLRLILIVAMTLGMLSANAHTVTVLPYLKSNYTTFSQSVSTVENDGKQAKIYKTDAEQFKKEVEAKKVKVATLADGRVYFVAFDKNKRIAMRSAEGKDIKLDYNQPWCTDIRISKIKGDDEHYYFELIGIHQSLGEFNIVRTTDGDYIMQDYKGLRAFKIGNNVYVQGWSPRYDFAYKIAGAYPPKGSTVSSQQPIRYVEQSDAVVAKDTIGGYTINLPTYPRPSHFATVEGARWHLDGKEEYGNRYGDIMMFKNSGYAISTFAQKPLKVSGSSDASISIRGEGLDQFDIYAPDRRLLAKDCSEAEFSETDQTLYFTKRDISGRQCVGAINLTDTLQSVPASFANVKCARNADGSLIWLVCRKAYEPLEIYEAGKDYTPVFRNKLEKDYNERNFFSVWQQIKCAKIDTLTFEDIRLGLSAYTLEGSQAMKPVKEIVSIYRQGREPKGMNDPHSTNSLSIGILNIVHGSPIYCSLDDLCSRMMSLAPAKEKASAQQIADAAKATDEEMGKLYYIELEEAKTDYKNMLEQRRLNQLAAEAEAKRRAIEAQQEQARLQAERNQAFAIAFLNGLSNILQNALSTPSKPARATNSVGNRQVGNTRVSGSSSGGGYAPDNNQSTQTQSSPGSKRICHACYGSGKCPHCHGKGVWDPNTNGHKVPCDPCNRTGKCHACNGTGHH